MRNSSFVTLNLSRRSTINIHWKHHVMISLQVITYDKIWSNIKILLVPLPCQRTGQGHNGNSRPVKIVLITIMMIMMKQWWKLMTMLMIRMKKWWNSWQCWWLGSKMVKIHDNVDDDMDLWEWEVCGKFKAAKLWEGTIDKGERQNLKVNTVNKDNRVVWVVRVKVSGTRLKIRTWARVSFVVWILLSKISSGWQSWWLSWWLSRSKGTVSR